MKIKKSKVKTMSQLRILILQHKSVDFFQKLFKVIYGFFNINHDWSKQLEERYMKKMNLSYTNKKRSKYSARDKSCFEILETDIKSEIVEHLQQQGKTSQHGRYLTLNFPQKDGKRVQRIKGMFYLKMIKRSSKNSAGTNESDKDESYTSDLNESLVSYIILQY